MHTPVPWADIPFFLALARTGTLSGAGRELKIDRTTVARRLASLEQYLEEPVFRRQEGRFFLTPYGQKIFAAATNAENELSRIHSSGKGGQPQKEKIRITLSEHLLLVMNDRLSEFMREYPDILPELTATDRYVDFAHFETDIAFRISKGTPENLVTRKIGKPVLILYGSRNANPDEKKCYIAHPNIKRVPKYVLNYLPDARLSIAVDGLIAMRELISRGAGVGILPQYFGDHTGDLEKLSDPLPNPGFSLSILCRPELRRNKRIRNFIQYMEDYLRSLKGIE